MSYHRYFFKCRDCGFMMTTLAQANKQILGVCPSCESGDFDYAPPQAREAYLRDLMEELAFVHREERARKALKGTES